MTSTFPQKQWHEQWHKAIESMVRNLSTAIALSYLVFMFVMTHLPKHRVSKAVELAGDKNLHLLAFLALGFLASLAIQLWIRHIGWYAYVLPCLVFGLAYAWFDEATQPLVGRHYDLRDMLADGFGLAMGMLLFEGLRPAVFKLLWIEETR